MNSSLVFSCCNEGSEKKSLVLYLTQVHTVAEHITKSISDISVTYGNRRARTGERGSRHHLPRHQVLVRLARWRKQMWLSRLARAILALLGKKPRHRKNLPPRLGIRRAHLFCLSKMTCRATAASHSPELRYAIGQSDCECCARHTARSSVSCQAIQEQCQPLPPGLDLVSAGVLTSISRKSTPQYDPRSCGQN